jgi:hypothetical protein
MTPKLSLRTQTLVEKLFIGPEQSIAAKWLVEDCGNNLPFCKDWEADKMERIRFAVLKLSNGNPLKLLEAIELAKKDWRDVLMWSDFGNDLDAHNKWAEQILK